MTARRHVMRGILPAWILGLSPIAMGLALLASIRYGANAVDWPTIWEAFFRFDSENVNHQIVMHSRLPRAIGALLIGGFLAVSGAVMQGMTRNPLASPSIMGVSDGALFAITLCMVFLPESPSLTLIIFSMIGSVLGAGLVLGLAFLLPNGMSVVQMAILGTLTGMFLNSISAAIASYFHFSQNVSFWYNARLHQIDPDLIQIAAPFALVGLIIALVISRSITILSLGEEVSVGLGQRTAMVKTMAILSVVLLTGVSVALAGSIGFVGLIIPHITRFLVGMDYRKVIPCAGVLGAVFLVLSDILSRFINYPFETPIGVVTSLFGTPIFLCLIYKKGG